MSFFEPAQTRTLGYQVFPAEGKVLTLVGIAICMVSGWALVHVLPARFQRGVAITMMIAGPLMLISCLLRSYEIIEPSPTADAIFIALLLGGPLIFGSGVYLFRHVTGTD